MKTVKAISLATLIAITLACGYSSKTTTPPPVPGPMPAISQLSPSSARAGSGAFTLTVNGSNFATNAVVNWNSSPQAATAVVSGSQLTVAIPASMIATAGSAMISVTNPATMGSGGRYGTGGTLAETSTNMTFTVN